MDDILSLDQADRILAYLKMGGMLTKDGSPCILVANKTDMVRNRVVKSSGRSHSDISALCGSFNFLTLFDWKIRNTSESFYFQLEELWPRSTTLSILKHLLVSKNLDFHG